jgi:glucan biosynthesis protein
MAVLFVVLGTATVCFNRCWDDSKQLRRNADDITRSLHAGEQWRADVRAATGEIHVINEAGGQEVTIPERAARIVYNFSGGEVRRQAGASARPALLLKRVRSSQMQPESRPHVTAWRWELELAPVKKNARIRPLFTFETVAGHPRTQ